MSDIMDKITNHLEFLGYSIEPITGLEGALLAKSNKNLNVVYQEKGYGVLFTHLLTMDKNKKDKLGMLNAINAYNNKLLVSRSYVTDGVDFIFLEATYPLSYDKTTFGVFVDAIQRDSANAFDEGIGLKNYIE
jgi:hypothetical protein